MEGGKIKMKNLIPVSLILAGALSMALPVYDHIKFLNAITHLQSISAEHPMLIGQFPMVPVLFPLIHFLTGVVLIYFGIRFSNRCFQD